MTPFLDTRRVLALDFDGVICDSIEECLVTGYGVYRERWAPEALPVQVPEPLKAEFRARRGYVRPSGHYFLLWKWITESPSLRLLPQEFEALASRHARDIEEFAARFHAARDRFRESAPTRWLTLNPLYPGVLKTWSLLPVSALYVVTTKDRASIAAILDAYALSVTGIFARGDMSKPHALAEIAKAHGGPQNVVFVDDNTLHLSDEQANGVTTWLAAWGYGPRAGFVGTVLECFADLPAALRAHDTRPSDSETVDTDRRTE